MDLEGQEALKTGNFKASFGTRLKRAKKCIERGQKILKKIGRAYEGCTYWRGVISSGAELVEYVCAQNFGAAHILFITSNMIFTHNGKIQVSNYKIMTITNIARDHVSTLQSFWKNGISLRTRFTLDFAKT